MCEAKAESRHKPNESINHEIYRAVNRGPSLSSSLSLQLQSHSPFPPTLDSPPLPNPKSRRWMNDKNEDRLLCRKRRNGEKRLMMTTNRGCFYNTRHHFSNRKREEGENFSFSVSLIISNKRYNPIIKPKLFSYSFYHQNQKIFKFQKQNWK